MSYFTNDERKEEVLHLWRELNVHYRTLEAQYVYLYDSLKESGQKNLHPVPDRELRKRPEIGLLEIFDESVAIAFIDNSSKGELCGLIYQLTNLKSSFWYNTLRGRVRDYDYRLRNLDFKASPFFRDTVSRNAVNCKRVSAGC